MRYANRLVLFLLLAICTGFNSFAVTYNWNTMTAGSLTYTSGNMSAVITSTNFDTRGPQDPNGGSNSGYRNPKYVSNATIATYQGGNTNDYGQQGMVLGVDWPNLTSSTTVTITFANPVAGPVSFTLYDINTGSGFGYDPIWVDRITLSGTNCAGTAIYPTITGCANTISGTNSNIITGRSTCTNNTNTITFNSGTLKTITLTYGSGTALASGYGTDPDPQYIIISSITTGNDLSATIAPNTGIGCSASSVTLSASTTIPGGTYAWTGPAPATTPAGTTPTAATTSVSAAGTYTVVVTDPVSGCTATNTTTVTGGGTPPTVSIATPATVTCSNPTVTLTATASSGVTYAWSGGGTAATKNVTTAGTYTVTVTGAGGCTATASTTVSADNTPPTVSINAHSNITCLNPSVTLNTTVTPANVTYTWSSSASGTSSTTVNAGGNYSVTVTDPLNGCTAIASTTVTQSTTPPTVSIATPAALSCTNNSVTLTASAAGTITYAWSGGTASGNTTVVSTGGTYTVTATNTSGCTATASATVTSNTTPPTVSIGPAATVTCSNPSSTLTASVSGTVTYAWSGGGTGNTKNVTAGGTYTVTVTGTNGCTATASVIVDENKTAPTVSINPHADITCANPTVTLNTTVTPANVTYIWSNSASGTSSTTANAGGNYSVTVTNPANGCTATASTTVVQNSTPPTVSIATPATITCTATAVTLTATSPDIVTYAWSGGTVTGNTTLVTTGGTYTVTVTNAALCTATASATVTTNNTPPTVSIAAPQLLNCTTTTTTLVASGTNIASYSWTGGSNNATLGVSSPGTYTVTVTATNGCTATAFAIVDRNVTQPTVSIDAHADLSCAVSSVTLSATATPGNVTYAWTGGATTATNLVNTAGTYSVTVTHPVSGCTATASTTVLQTASVPQVSIATPTAIDCNNTSSTLTASSPDNVTYVWSNTTTGNTITVTSGGTYSVTATDAGGCSASASATVVDNTTPPTVGIAAVAALNCTNTSATLTATANVAVTYSWTGGTANATLNVTAGGTYAVTVTAANGCTASTSIIVIQDIAQPTVSIAPHANLTCATSNVTLTATGLPLNVTYAWTGGGTGNTLNVNSAGQYDVTVTNPANGCTATASTTVTQAANVPQVSIGTPTIIDCNNTTATLTASSPDNVTYVWNNTTTGNTITVSSGGTYTVTATDAGGCSASASVTVTQDNASPSVSISTPSIITCAAPSATLVASSPDNVTYVWSNSSPGNTITVTNGGTYSVTATSANGCTASQSVTVVQNATPPTVNITGGTTLDCITTNTTLTATSATAVSYAWSNSVNTAVNTVSSGGQYTVTATDGTGCTATASVTVTQSNTPPTVSIAAPAEINCTNSAVTLTASSPDNVTYTWASGTGATSTVTGAGTYTVTATNAAGCTATASATVTQNTTLPSVSISTPAQINCTNSSVTLTASSPDNVTYAWAGSTGATNTVSSAGNYSVTVTGTNGCTATATAAVAQDIARPTVSIAKPDTITCSVSEITLTATSASPNATFDWSNTADSSATEVTAAGTYYVTVTNPTNGCTALDSVLVAANTSAPGVYAGEDTVLATGGVTLTATSASQSVSYVWNNQSVTPSIQVSVSGVYFVTATDSINGCSSVDSVRVKDVSNSDIKIPNVFTPNGDGLNDVFYPRTASPTNVVIKAFRVYNRWGALIHNNPAQGWDGTFKSAGQPSETYLFFVQYEAPEQGTSNIKDYYEQGSFSLLR